MWNHSVKKHHAIFREPPKMVPDGNVDVSGNGRWKIWQDAGTKIDAPILGNGDMLAAFAGPLKWPQYWVTTNDFWQMESAANWEFFHDNSVAKFSPAMSLGSPRPIGRLVFDIPQLKNARYYTEQNFSTAKTTTTYTLENDKKVVLTGYVAATENILILKFETEIPLDITYDFYFPDETGKGCDRGIDFDGYGERDEIRNLMFTGMLGGKPLQVKKIRDGLISGYRQFSDQVDIPVKAGFAGRFLCEKKKEMTEPDYRNTTKHLEANSTDTFVFAVRTWEKSARPYEYACSRIGYITEKEVAQLEEQHLRKWRKFWETSEFHISDELLEQRYYLSKYMLRSVAADPGFPPNILGISTFDRMAWNGNYKINYNHQSPYLNLMVSGHFEQSDTHDQPYLDLLEITKEMSLRLTGHEGVYYPLGLGPKGMVSEALLLHMKSPALHGALNMLMRFQLTLDLDYAEKVYPFLLGVADFWEEDLVLRDGRYHVIGDGMHERDVANVKAYGYPEDPVNTLGYLKTFFSTMPEISEVLELDEDRRKKWKEIAERIAEFPVGTIREITENPTLWTEADASLQDLVPEEMLDLPVFYDEGKGGKWSLHFPGNVMQIYPGNAIGLSSDAKLLEIAKNTVLIHSEMEHRLAKLNMERDQKEGKEITCPHCYRAGAWNASNLSCLFFTAAARVGHSAEEIIQEMREMIRNRGLANGYIDGNPHGIENLNTIPDALQEMMLQSHEGIIRLFPVWPGEMIQEAYFKDFRAYGAFEVSASLYSGNIEDVRIKSKKGSRCKVENPWKGKKVCLIRKQSRQKEIVTGDEIVFETFAGEEITMMPADPGTEQD